MVSEKKGKKRDMLFSRKSCINNMLWDIHFGSVTNWYRLSQNISEELSTVLVHLMIPDRRSMGGGFVAPPSPFSSIYADVVRLRRRWTDRTPHDRWGHLDVEQAAGSDKTCPNIRPPLLHSVDISESEGCVY